MISIRYFTLIMSIYKVSLPNQNIAEKKKLNEIKILTSKGKMFVLLQIAKRKNIKIKNKLVIFVWSHNVLTESSTKQFCVRCIELNE